MADPKVIYENGKYYAVAPSASWSGWTGDTEESKLWPDATGTPSIDLQIWVLRNMGKVASKMTTKQGFPAVELTGLGDYKGPTTGGPDPGRAGVSFDEPSVHETYADAQAHGNRVWGSGTQDVRWWISLSKRGKPVVEAIKPGEPKPPRDKRIIGSQNMPGTDMIQFSYADGSVSNPIARTKEPESGVGSSTYSEGVREAIRMQVASIPVEGGPPVFNPGYVLALDTDPSSKTHQKWVVRTASSMTAAEIARARKMAEDELATAQTQSELSRMLSVMESDKPFGGVVGEAQPIYDQSGNIIQYAIQEYDAAGNLSTRYVKAPEPTVMAQPEPAAQVVSTDQGMYQYADNEWSPLGMSEKPATLEMQGGMMWMRDTSGNLSPVNDVLERMIEQKIIEGDWDAALQWDDFRNRPSPQEHLQAMLDYARTPADQMLLSAIARGYSEGAVPPNAGELGRVGPVPAEAREAWERYQRSITGTGSEMSEMQSFLKEESDTRTAQETERVAQDDLRWQGLSDVVTEFQTSTADQITAMQDNVAGMFNNIANSDFGKAFGMSTDTFEVAGDSSSTASPKGGSGAVSVSDSANIPEQRDSDTRIPEETRTEYFNRMTGQENMPVSGSGTLDSPWIQEGVGKENSADVNLLELIQNMVKSGEWEGGITSVSDKQWWSQKLFNMGGGGIGAKLEQNTIMDLISRMGRDPDLWEKQDPNASTIPKVNGKPFHGGVRSSWENLNTTMVSESTDAYKNRMLEEEARDKEIEEQRRADALEAEADLFRKEQEKIALDERSRQLGGANYVPISQRSRTQLESGAYVASSDAPVLDPATGTRRRPSDMPSTVSPLPTAADTAAFNASLGRYEGSGMRAPGPEFLNRIVSADVRQHIGKHWTDTRGQNVSPAFRAQYAGVSMDNPDLMDYEEFAEGGIVHGPTIALLGEKEPEVVIPLSKLPKMAEGGIVFSSAEQQPVGIQELLAGRSPRPLGGRLLNQAGMTLPSAQSWRNLSSDEQEIYGDLGARAGITSGYMQSELESARPSGGRGAGQASMLPLATRRIFR